MKKTFLTILFLTVFTCPALADHVADWAYIDRVDGYYDGSGGEFRFKPDADPNFPGLSNAAYRPHITKGIGGIANSFQTFCIEVTEYISTSWHVEAWMSTTFIDQDTGDIIGPGSHAVLGSKMYGDNLDPRTAYLYTQFAKGVLDGYDYDPDGNRAADAYELQKVFWVIEEEDDWEYDDLSPKAQGWYDDAVAAGWSDIGLVRVLNLYTYSSEATARQDMLYLIPAPGAAILGVIGLGLVGWMRRRS